MSSRKNFLDADNSMMERNLRFVKNDLEDNLNQYFGGAGGSRGNKTAITAPPRDYKVVQPKPGGSHALKPCQDLEERKQFLIQIGLARHEAYNLAKSLDFEVSYYMDIRNNWLKNGLNEKEVNTRLLYEIKSGDYKCDNYIADNSSGDYNQHRSFGNSNDEDRGRYNNRSNERNYSNKIIQDAPSERSSYQNSSRYQREDNIVSDSFKARRPAERGYSLQSSQLPRSTSPPKGFNYMQQEMGVGHNLRSTQSLRSRSPPRDFNSIQQEYNNSAGNDDGVGQNDRSLKRSNEKNLYRSNIRQNNRMMGASSQISNKQRERECPIYDDFQQHVDISPSGNMAQVRNRSDDLRKLTPSPPRGLHSMQQERGRSISIDNFRSSQPARSRSPPSGFNSMSPERPSINNLKDFQLSRMRLNSNQCNTKHDRDSSRNTTNFIEPLNKMGNEPSSSKLLSYGCNVNVSNLQQTHRGVGNQLTKPNVVPSMGDYTALFKRRRDINDQDFGNPNTPLLKGCTSSTSNYKPYHDNLRLGSGNSKNIPLFKGNRHASSNDNQILDFGSNSNIPISVEDVKQLKTIPSLLSLPISQLPTKGYWAGNTTSIPPLMGNNNTPSYDKPSQGNWIWAGNTTSIPPLMVNNNTPLNNNQFFDNGSNSNIPSLLSLPLNQFLFSYWPQPPTTSGIVKNPHGETERKLTFKEQRKLDSRKAYKEQQKLSKQLKKEKKRERRLERLSDPYQKPISSCPLIQCGFKKPPPGRSKAKPQEYWSQWWPRYKYIEKCLQKINFSMMKPYDIAVPPRKTLLLRIGINKILRNVDLKENDYSYRDTFKLFKYKKQLENSNFQNSLRSSELRRVQAALAQLENKNTMALLHQSMIYKWHFSLDIVKRAKAGELVKYRKAFNLLSDKIFDYFVLESIQQLKEICKAEWREFEEFYDSIDTTSDETDISMLIFDNGFTTETNYMAKQANEENNDEDDDDEDDEQDDEVREIIMDTERI